MSALPCYRLPSDCRAESLTSRYLPITDFRGFLPCARHPESRSASCQAETTENTSHRVSMLPLSSDSSPDTDE